MGGGVLPTLAQGDEPVAEEETPIPDPGNPAMGWLQISAVSCTAGGDPGTVSILLALEYVPQGECLETTIPLLIDGIDYGAVSPYLEAAGSSGISQSHRADDWRVPRCRGAVRWRDTGRDRQLCRSDRRADRRTDRRTRSGNGHHRPHDRRALLQTGRAKRRSTLGARKCDRPLERLSGDDAAGLSLTWRNRERRRAVFRFHALSGDR